MKPEHIESIKNWPASQSIRKIHVFIGFINFYRRFIRNFNAIAAPNTYMMKTSLSSKFSKLAKKSTVKPTKQDLTSTEFDSRREVFVRG